MTTSSCGLPLPILGLVWLPSPFPTFTSNLQCYSICVHVFIPARRNYVYIFFFLVRWHCVVVIVPRDSVTSTLRCDGTSSSARQRHVFVFVPV
ncbi:hypothetical protein B0H11DRAFT_1947107 [Mycena galericulata]|nr:hypothetical protein B0H11DRAFT_1947107 [Mycena galericulata]